MGSVIMNLLNFFDLTSRNCQTIKENVATIDTHKC